MRRFAATTKPLAASAQTASQRMSLRMAYAATATANAGKKSGQMRLSLAKARAGTSWSHWTRGGCWGLEARAMGSARSPLLRGSGPTVTACACWTWHAAQQASPPSPSPLRLRAGGRQGGAWLGRLCTAPVHPIAVWTQERSQRQVQPAGAPRPQQCQHESKSARCHCRQHRVRRLQAAGAL